MVSGLGTPAVVASAEGPEQFLFSKGIFRKWVISRIGDFFRAYCPQFSDVTLDILLDSSDEHNSCCIPDISLCLASLVTSTCRELLPITWQRTSTTMMHFISLCECQWCTVNSAQVESLETDKFTSTETEFNIDEVTFFRRTRFELEGTVWLSYTTSLLNSQLLVLCSNFTSNKDFYLDRMTNRAMFSYCGKICVLLAKELSVFNLNIFHMAGVSFNSNGNSTSRIRHREK